MPRRRPNPAFNAIHFPAATRRALRGIRIGLGAVQSLSMAQIVTAAAAAYGVDPSLAVAVAQRESGLNPNLVNPTSGAAGLMQLMPATFASLGGTNIMDPTQNANAGVRYLGMMLAKYNGDISLALSAYNAGEQRVDRDGKVPAIAETKNYVTDIMAKLPEK